MVDKNKELAFKERQILKSITIDKGLYDKIKNLIEERNTIYQVLIFDPDYETFLIDSNIIASD